MSNPAIYTKRFKTPFGELVLGDYENKLCLCDWQYRKMRSAIDKRITTGLQSEFMEKETPLIQNVQNQLEEYFNNQRKSFDLPLLFVGTDFQRHVWKELADIPFGQTSTYLNLAAKMGKPKAVRAVANANGANAISIIIPCHRIIGSNGKLVGYAGGLTAKKKRLLLEQNLFTL